MPLRFLYVNEMKVQLFFCLFALLFSSTTALSCRKIRFKQLTALRMGTYLAQCKPDGTWESKQCHASTGFCWCVDPDGRRLGSAIPPTSNVILECKK